MDCLGLYSLYTHYISGDSSPLLDVLPCTLFYENISCLPGQQNFWAAVILKGHTQTCPAGKKRQQYQYSTRKLDGTRPNRLTVFVRGFQTGVM
eukprot:s2737_g1.t1